MADRNDALLVVEGVTKAFPRRRSWREIARRPFASDRVEAIRDVSFDVSGGEFFGLLGANGAGKTTLMKVIATLMLPDGGRVVVGGADAVREASRVRESVALSLASERGLYWRLTARENLRIFAALYDVPSAEVEGRLDEGLASVGLDAGSRLVSEFSSGMIQRLLIARALIARPRVLLLDEPTRSLDPVSARDFRAFLRRELGQRGCAVVLATHNADEAFGLCDRVAVMERGRVMATGRASELAAAIGGRRFLVDTTAGGGAFLRTMVERGSVEAVASVDGVLEGWERLAVTVQGGDAAKAGSELVQALVAAGHPVAGCSVEPTSLADLISAVVRAEGHR